MDCRIVLVGTRIAANIGATARVMKNFGLTQLVLVAPEADPLDANARQLSTHGESILHNARIVADLDAAVGDCVMVAGTSARIGGSVRRQSVDLPDAIMPRLVDALPSGPAALVFGPEATGLSDAQVTRCHFLVHIPSDPAYPALNLAQSVAICVYELHRARLRAIQAPAPPRTIAPLEDQERLFANLRTALEQVHFLYGNNADSLMHAIRHLLGRAQLTPMEVDVLLGLARQIRWYVDKHGGGSVEPP